MCTGVPILSVSRIIPVPRDLLTMQTILQGGKPLRRPTWQSWIRLKAGRRVDSKYHEDVGLVVWVSNNGLLDVLAIPRINRAISKKHSKCRPLPALLTPNQRMAADLSPKKTTSSDHNNNPINSLDGVAYTAEGFILFTLLDADEYFLDEAWPTLVGLDSFALSPKLDLGTLQMTLAALQCHTLKSGAFVKIVCGEYAGISGRIMELSASGETATLHLPSQDAVYEAPLQNLRSEFHIGDYVSVVHGDLAGQTGWITNALAGSSVMIYDSQKHEEVSSLDIHGTVQ